MKPKLLVVCNDLDFFLQHRIPETRAALNAGYEVLIATPPGARNQEIIAEGFSWHPLPLTRSGRNPFNELRALISLQSLFRRTRPDLLYLMTVKPILYGGIAARLAGVPAVVAAVFGLGYLFTDQRFSTRVQRALVSLLYRIALSHPKLKVFFQNPADREVLVRAHAVAPEKTLLIPGSGVDLSRFKEIPEPKGVPVVLMAARLLRDKGVREFIEAASMLRAAGVEARFQLAGNIDPGNPSSFSESDLQAWRSEGTVELLGFRSDMPNLLADANLVVLPSYREGLPRVLEEAAACGRAIVCTDVPGCRDAIVPGQTGLLARARDANDLARSIAILLRDSNLRHSMAKAGRRLAEERYAVERITEAHLSLYRSLLDQ